MSEEWMTTLLAGLGGSFCWAFFNPDRISVLRSLWGLATGTVIAVFTAPAFCDYMEWQTLHQRNALAFGIGLMGTLLCRQALRTVETEAAGLIVKAIRRFFGINDKDEHSPTEN